MTDPAVSGTARQRIRRFSVFVWVWGAVVLSIGAFTTYTDVGLGADGLGIIGGDADAAYPWQLENPPLIEPDGTTYSGTGGGLIRIPLEDHTQEPYLVRLVSEGYLSLSQTDAADLGQPADDRRFPVDIGYLSAPDDEILVLPQNADLELWVDTDGPWEFVLQTAVITEITDGFAAGTDSDVLVYHGDAVSARFLHRGDGIFFVSIQMLGERLDMPIIESGEVDQRLSWKPTGAVYITIEADDGRGAWSVDIDELATDAPAETDPGSDPASDPESPAPVALAPRGHTLR